jgi:hypothetical protein
MHRPLTGLLVLAATTWFAVGGGSTADAAGSPTTVARLEAPKTSYAQDTLYFQDLAKVDQNLTTYVDKEQQVALQALLTDGSAFCAFLARGDGIDVALEDTALGADSVEKKTHLPRSVKTFNSIEAVALVTLCPSEQKLLPKADEAHIKALEHALSAPSTSTPPSIPSSLPSK